MSLADCRVPITGTDQPPALKLCAATRPLHRLAAVRKTQGVTYRTVARRLKTNVATVKMQEQEDADLLLSTLYQWQEVLDVPVGELLVEAEDPLSSPVMQRAQLLRLMKSAMAILQRSKQASIRRMAQVMVTQLIEIMPELTEVSPWHAVGKRRTQSEIGQTALRQLPVNFMADFGE
jgi:transcriptional regulator with XRE-family HTH domain